MSTMRIGSRLFNKGSAAIGKRRYVKNEEEDRLMKMIEGEGRYLTKSRFQLAMQCPAKLYFDGKPEYANRRLEDEFLASLADGGFQVGALARCYFPGGIMVEAKDPEEALLATAELLKQENATIFEAAFRFQNLLIRADILVKQGDYLELIEVKAKSFDPNGDSFLTRSGLISSGWSEYLYDVAFQKHVIRSAFSEFNVSAHLMMADKSAKCPTDGLNQKFRIIKDDRGRKKVAVSSSLTEEDLTPPILAKVCADDCCSLIYGEEFATGEETMSFAEFADFLADRYVRDEKIQCSPSTACGSCEYTATEEELKKGLKSGFRECWSESLGWQEEDFDEPTVLEIWNCRKKNRFLEDGRVQMKALCEEDILPKWDGKPGISASERQWLQIEKSRRHDNSYWIDRENLAREMSAWVYPLHFIDFETSMAAIPFNKGRHPYEGVAFQFSHHVVDMDGRIEHKGQYLNAEPGVFPNYEFVRRLKEELEQDKGSVFRYAAHENTYLNMIYRQLLGDESDILDREALCAFIRTITKSDNGSLEKWEGPRSMIDMCELVKRYYYDPATKGSNSIKYILPAILNSSEFLQEKYSAPIYGAEGGIVSLNYRNWKWIEYQDGKVLDPYKLLPKMFRDVTEKEFELLSENEEIRNGGAALTAYARMQFEEMSDYECAELRKALLKYCELDTMAMVMIYEGWRDFVR